MPLKTRILFVSRDKINILSNMIARDVIVIKYNYKTDTYNTLQTRFLHIIKNNQHKLNIKSIAIFASNHGDNIGVINNELIDLNAKYSNNIVSIVNFESFIHCIICLLRMINSNKNRVKLDIIATNVIADKSDNILNTISKNTGIIINTSLNKNYSLNYSTHITSNSKNNLIIRYFTKKIYTVFDKINNIDTHKNVTEKIISIFNSALVEIKSNPDIYDTLNTLRILIGSISNVLRVIFTAGVAIDGEMPLTTLPVFLISPTSIWLYLGIVSKYYWIKGPPNSVGVLFTIIGIIEILCHTSVVIEWFQKEFILDKKNINNYKSDYNLSRDGDKLANLTSTLKNYLNMIPNIEAVSETIPPDMQTLLNFANTVVITLKNLESSI